MANPKYKRILIKLSGEALAGERGVGIDIQTVQTIAKEIQEVHSLGIEIALVIGGGNLWRGEPAAEAGMDRVQADYTGMLGTVMNALVMADSLQQVGVDTRVQTAIAMQQVAEPYVRGRALRHLEKGRIVQQTNNTTTVEYNIRGKNVVLEFATSTSPNPFNLAKLHNFNCI